MDYWNPIGYYGVNLMVAFIFIVMIYNRYRTPNLDYVFTYFMFNTIIFFVSLILSAITLSIGFAFGLFAIFGILRYRTEPIPIREMTYLFGIISIGLINGLAANESYSIAIMMPNLAILILTFALEQLMAKHILQRKVIIYENIDNIKPQNKEQLLADLKARTGLDIVKYEIRRVDFLRDIARVRIFYREG